jgi:Ser/Thr protein kinase RdoA (MazF antagonist)
MSNEYPKETQQLIPPLPSSVMESHNAIVQLTQTYAKLLQSLADERNQHIATWRAIAEQTKKQLDEQRLMNDEQVQQIERLRIALNRLEQLHGQSKDLA